MRTQVRLGTRDFVLLTKQKGDRFYKQVDVESFGQLPPLNFDLNNEMSPGSPKGRMRFTSSEGEEDEKSNKRKNFSGSESPILRKSSKPRIQDMSYDDSTINN